MGCPADYYFEMASLADRVWYAIHCLPRRSDGQPPDAKSLELRAGVSNATIGKIVRGLRPTPAAKTVAKLSLVLGVTPTWLVDGVGDAPSLTGPLPPRLGAEDVDAWRPDPDSGVFTFDPYPTRAPVIAAMRSRGDDPAVIDSMLAEFHDSGDPGQTDEDYWWKRVKYYKGKINAFLEADTSALDHVPGRKR